MVPLHRAGEAAPPHAKALEANHSVSTHNIAAPYGHRRPYYESFDADDGAPLMLKTRTPSSSGSLATKSTATMTALTAKCTRSHSVA